MRNEEYISLHVFLVDTFSIFTLALFVIYLL